MHGHGGMGGIDPEMLFQMFMQQQGGGGVGGGMGGGMGGGRRGGGMPQGFHFG
jgi:DnaJ family protein C protein 7